MLESLFKNLFDSQKTIAPQCPWYDWQEAYGAPNIKWCEETLCQYITEPANSWINLAYLLVAFFIFKHGVKHSHKTAIWLAPAIVITGYFSFLYHATNNAWTQFLDFFGMYFYVGFMLSINLVRLEVVKYSNVQLFIISIVLFYSGLFFLFPKIGLAVQLIIVLASVLIIVSEYILYRYRSEGVDYFHVVWSGILIVIAESFSLLDAHRVLCQPSNHFFQGHALWHVISAFSMWFAYKFYSQFELED